MVIIDPELMKPLKCTECHSRKIANMVNEGVFRCLDCGKEKPDPNSVREIMRREMGPNNAWQSRNIGKRKPFRDF